MILEIFLDDQTQDDQTQVDSKPAGQPEHASLNQCQLLAADRCSGHPKLAVEIRFLCNVIDTRALIGPCSHVTKPAGQPEHASLNQCQLLAANRCSGHPKLAVEIRFLCNVIDTRALIGPCSHVTSC